MCVYVHVCVHVCSSRTHTHTHTPEFPIKTIYKSTSFSVNYVNYKYFLMNLHATDSDVDSSERTVSASQLSGIFNVKVSTDIIMEWLYKKDANNI